MLRFYVYAYLRDKDSTIAKAGTPYYIGKGVGARAWRHCNNDAIHPPLNKDLIVILERNLTDIGAFAIERRMIRWYGRINNNTGILRNQTDGGEGTGGYKQTHEHIEKRKKSPESLKRWSDLMKSKRTLETTRKAVTTRKQNNKNGCTSETRKKISAAMKGRLFGYKFYHNPITKEMVFCLPEHSPAGWARGRVRKTITDS